MKRRMKTVLFAVILALTVATFGVTAFAASGTGSEAISISDDNELSSNYSDLGAPGGALSESEAQGSEVPDDDVSGGEVPDSNVPDGDGDVLGGDAPGGDVPDGDVSGGDAHDEENETTSENGDELKDNSFATAFEIIKSYSSEIMSALAFIGSLILAFAYKKGLMPIIKNTLSAFGTALSKIRESQDASDSSNKAASEALAARLSLAEDNLDVIGKNLDAMTECLKENEKCEKERKSMRVIMLGQIDMLYGIFMTANLPQYEKDMIGERIQAMREELQGKEE